jgi:Ala-tRNA(Pro) deacylase
MMTLELSRPQSTEGRLKKEVRTYDFLDKLGIEYYRVDHEPAMTMEACLAIEGVLGARICKNLFLTNRQKTAFYLLMIPGDKIFKTKDISAPLGTSRLSFGDGELMEQLLDITPGSLSVLGLMNDLDHDVTLLIDKDVLDGEYIGCHPCINTSTLKIKVSDLMDKVIPALKHRPTMVSLPRYTEEEAQ